MLMFIPGNNTTVLKNAAVTNKLEVVYLFIIKSSKTKKTRLQTTNTGLGCHFKQMIDIPPFDVFCPMARGRQKTLGLS